MYYKVTGRSGKHFPKEVVICVGSSHRESMAKPV